MADIYDKFGINFSLYPKQRLFLAHPDDTKNIPGYLTPKEVLFGGAAGSSKATPLTSAVVTPFGVKTMGTMKVGSQVINPDGTVATVTQIHPQGIKDIFKITFSDGSSARCTKDHLWLVNFNTNKVTIISEGVAIDPSNTSFLAGQIISTEDLISFFANEPLAAMCPVIPVTQPVVFSHYSSPTFSEADAHMFGATLCNRKQGNSVTKLLEDLDLSGKDTLAKYIPVGYLYSSVAARFALLQGLLDVNGFVDVSTQSVTIDFEEGIQLSKDVKFLVESLGGTCTVTIINSTELQPTMYHCSIVIPTMSDLFGCVDKKELVSTALHSNGSSLSRRMVFIEPDGREEAQCITVDNPNGLYLTDDFIVTHNSFALRAISVILALECPGVNIFLFRRTYSELGSNHMEGPNGYRAWLSTAVRNKLVNIDAANNIIKFKNGPDGSFAGGSMIYLRHVQHDKDMYKYLGAEIHVLMIDEATRFTPEIYAFLRSRVRMGSWAPPEKWKGYFPRILMGSNPGGPAHLYYKRNFVDFVDHDNKFCPKYAPVDDGGMLRQYIPGTVYDNPALLKDDPTYVERLKGLGSAELVKAMLEGDWDIVAGGMFDDVWDKDFVTIAPFKIPENWYINRGFDWGSAAPFACIWFAESNGEEVALADGSFASFPRGTLFIIEELYGNNPNARDLDKGIMLSNVEIGYRIRDKENNSAQLRDISHKILPGPADNQIFNIMNNDTIARGINAGYWGGDNMKNMDVFFRSDKSAGSRIRRWSLMRDRFAAALKLKDEIPMENEGLIIFRNCNDTIRTLPTLPRKENDPEDIADGVPDHIADVVGYRCLQKGGGMTRLKVKLG